MILWPSVAEERELALRQRFAHVRPIATQKTTAWQSSSPWIALLFFGLTLFAVTATFGFFSLLSLPKGWITAALCIGVAELLIQGRRMFGTGIESALWIGGLFAFLFGLTSEGKPEALLAFAAASAIAGLRVRNPYFGTLASLLVVIYLAVVQHGSAFWGGGAAPLALALTLAAAFGLLRRWSRPSTDALLVAHVVVMPVAAYVTGKILSDFHFDAPVAATFALLAALLVTLGLARRNHAVLIAGLLSFACLVVEVHDLLDASMEARLIAGGIALLAITAAVSRLLRGRTLGVVSERTEMTQLEQVIQLGGAVAIAHPQPAAESPQLEAGGGEFGGAGASGGF